MTDALYRVLLALAPFIGIGLFVVVLTYEPKSVREERWRRLAEDCEQYEASRAEGARLWAEMERSVEAAARARDQRAAVLHRRRKLRPARIVR